MTSKKRRYGDLSASPPPSEDPGLLDDVFAAFTGKRTTDAPPPTPALRAAPVPDATPAQEAAPAQPASVAPMVPEPLHDAAEARRAAPARQAGVAGYTRVSNDLLDRILPTLDTYDQAVLVRLYRLSRGFSSDTCRVSAPTLAKACNVSERQVRKSVAKLEARELIQRVEQDFGNRDKTLRGTIFRILIADPTPARGATPARYAAPAQGAAPARGAANKDKDFKENSKRGVDRLAPEEIEAKTAEVVERLRADEGIDEIAAELAPTMHPVDWAAVRSMAEASHKR
jgi:DNA-binding Lrp family transcriptional regulator